MNRLRRRVVSSSMPLEVRLRVESEPSKEGGSRWAAFAQWSGVVVALVAALGALWFNHLSSDATNRQLDVATQGEITDRYSTAVEQLASKSLEVRLGGIYALERIMTDSSRDQPTIVDVLAAFVRQSTAGRKTANADHAYLSGVRPPLPPVDLSAAITVLGRRDAKHDAPHQLVDLKQVNLAGYDLTGVQIPGADLTMAHFEGSILDRANLHGAILDYTTFGHAQMVGANLSDAHLDGTQMDANLDFANLSGANAVAMNFGDTDLLKANLDGAKLHQADLSGVRLALSSLRGTDLSSAVLFNADLSGSNLTDANLTGALASGARLVGANLSRANLTRAQLQPATFGKVKWPGADVTDAVLTGAVGVNLRGTIGTPAH